MTVGGDLERRLKGKYQQSNQGPSAANCLYRQEWNRIVHSSYLISEQMLWSRLFGLANTETRDWQPS
jgi:hypothetical protein